MLSIFLGWSLIEPLSASLSFLFRMRIGSSLSGPVYVSKKALKPVAFTLNCCKSPLRGEHNDMTSLNIHLKWKQTTFSPLILLLVQLLQEQVDHFLFFSKPSN